MSEIVESIDRLGATLKEILAQSPVVMSPLNGMDISSNMLGWVRVEKALEEIQSFENTGGNRRIAPYETLVTNLKKILMGYKPI